MDTPGVWLPGHSPVSGGKGQLERQLAVRAVLPEPPLQIAMHFAVDGYKRRGHFFDMESLGYVVLATWRHDLSRSTPVKIGSPYRPLSIWITMHETSNEQGVWFTPEAPASPSTHEVVESFEVAGPPTRSARGTVIPEVEGRQELDSGAWLGLELAFGRHVDIGEFGFNGPIKPLIDAMGPLLGRDARGGPADHRLHDLRIAVDDRTDSSVGCRWWYVED